MPDPKTQTVVVAGTLPGEMLACKVIDLIIALQAGMSAEQKQQMWEWAIEDGKRWRKFWGIGGDA